MIQSLGVNLYTATEVSELIGVTRETLGTYAKRAEIKDRRIRRVRYYTEEEIRQLLQIPGENTRLPKEETPTDSGEDVLLLSPEDFLSSLDTEDKENLSTLLSVLETSES